jgi:hypothetical protein
MKNARFFYLFLMFVGTFAFSQKSGKINPENNYPSQFEIKKQDIENLYKSPAGKKINSKNKYLRNSTVLHNNQVGENIQIKLKMDYFKDSELILQKNGNNSLIIFILSNKNNLYYTNNLNGDFSFDGAGNVTMKKCTKDDIVSE